MFRKVNCQNHIHVMLRVVLQLLMVWLRLKHPLDQQNVKDSASSGNDDKGMITHQISDEGGIINDR